MMNINEVQKRIKQRPPFQMIEKVLEVEDGEYAKGIKCVSVNEPYFAGHFPDAPIMPGDCLEIEVRKESGGAGLVKFNAKVTVDGKVKAKGILAFTSMNKEDIYNQ